MQLFKFNSEFTYNSTILGDGEQINGVTSVSWTERYSDVGEFEINAQLSSGLKDFLPPGTLISHVDTMEVMMVENHEINEKSDEDPTIKITGRSLPGFLSYRIVGIKLARAGSLVTEYVLASNSVSLQAAALIQDHIQNATQPGDVLENINTYASVASGPIQARNIPIGPVLPEVLKLLAMDDLGIRTIRKNPFGIGVGGTDIQTVIEIYKGTDQSDRIVYSSRTGHMDSVDYLFSNKAYFNSALILGRYVWAVAEGGGTEYDRRQIVVDGSDIDGYLSAAPTGGTLTAIVAKMQARGYDALLSQEAVNIARADIAATDPYRYRTDYNLGDLITVAGNYGENAVMRIVEYVEIEDENGETSHPTFSLPTFP